MSYNQPCATQIMEDTKTELERVRLYAIALVKLLCIDTEADKAELEQNISFKGKDLGRYRITIKKIR